MPSLLLFKKLLLNLLLQLLSFSDNTPGKGSLIRFSNFFLFFLLIDYKVRFRRIRVVLVKLARLKLENLLLRALACHTCRRAGLWIGIHLNQQCCLIALVLLGIPLLSNPLWQYPCQLLQTVRFFLFDTTIGDLFDALGKVEVITTVTRVRAAVVDGRLLAEVRHLLFYLLSTILTLRTRCCTCCSSSVSLYSLERSSELVSCVCTLVTVVNLLWWRFHQNRLSHLLVIVSVAEIRDRVLIGVPRVMML